MQDFYGLVLNGTSPQQALQKTQLKFIKDKTIQAPFFGRRLRCWAKNN